MGEACFSVSVVRGGRPQAESLSANRVKILDMLSEQLMLLGLTWGCSVVRVDRSRLGQGVGQSGLGERSLQDSARLLIRDDGPRPVSLPPPVSPHRAVRISSMIARIRAKFGIVAWKA